MRKLLLSAVIALGALTASAQRTSTTSTSFFSTDKAEQGVTYGIEAGVNMATWTGDISDAKTRTSFNAGFVVNVPFMQSLYLKTGLYYTEKGVKGDEGVNVSAGYLQIPILASYRYNFSESTQLQVNFGPYLAYGITGTVKSDDESDYDTFGDDGLLKSFDAGLHLGTGVTFASHYYVGLGYEFGLSNIFEGDSGDDYSVKNGNFFINLGYTF